MPCEVNSILKLAADAYPAVLEVGVQAEAVKPGYRIFPIDVPIALVDSQWLAHADVVIRRLTWERGQTYLRFEIQRVYAAAFPVKEIP